MTKQLQFSYQKLLMALLIFPYQIDPCAFSSVKMLDQSLVITLLEVLNIKEPVCFPLISFMTFIPATVSALAYSGHVYVHVSVCLLLSVLCSLDMKVRDFPFSAKWLCTEICLLAYLNLMGIKHLVILLQLLGMN